MPTVLRFSGFRLFFYSNEGNEPPHINVEKGDDTAKFWLLPQVHLADNFGFSNKEINSLQKIISQNQQKLIDSWNEYFG